MRSDRWFLVRSAAVLCVAALAGAQASGQEAKDAKEEGKEAKDAPRLGWKLEKGTELRYSTRREETSEGESTRGEFSSTSTTAVQYDIKVDEVKEGGDLVLSVTPRSIRASRKGGRFEWEFDSTKEATGEEQEIGGLLRERVGKALRVTVGDGKIRSIEGLPEPPQEGDRAAAFRRGMVSGIAGRRAIETDLGHIFALAPHGKKLAEGETYAPAAAEDDRDGERSDGRRGRGRGFGRPVAVAYKVDALRETDKGGTARFALVAAPRDESDDEDDARRGRTELDGAAVVSLADGLLLELSLASKNEGSWERDGQSFSYKTSGKATIEREAKKAPESRVD